MLAVGGHGGQAAAMHAHPDLVWDALKDRKLLFDAVGQAAQHGEIEFQIGDIEAGRQGGGVVLHRVRFVAAEHEAALIGTNIDVGVDDARDRLVGLHAGDRLGDHQLMAGRHDGHARAGQRGDGAQPCAGRIDHDIAGYVAMFGVHAGDGIAVVRTPVTRVWGSMTAPSRSAARA